MSSALQTTDGQPGQARVLVVEDDESLAAMLAEELGDCGYHVHVTDQADAAEQMLDSWHPDLVVSDLRLPKGDGLDLLQRAKRRDGAPAFVIITAFGTISQAVDALKAGADDFLTKPLDLDHLLITAERVLETRRLRREVERFRALVRDDGFHGMIGRSQSMRRLFEQIRQIARGQGPVLIQGESGTGKELAARAIHAESEASGPFLAVNCAGIPSELLESEFFGHTSGAFTGAQRSRRGLFQEADGGTLLLDEIGEMPLALQPKLLRVLQDGRVRPVGAEQDRAVSVRVLAATNRDPDELLEQNLLRADLFYRLEAFTLRLPPLRERGDDVELLAAHFLERHSAALGKRIAGFSEAALQMLKRYPFPGNVRELDNAIERAATFCDQGSIQVTDLPQRLRQHGGIKEQPSGDHLPDGLFGEEGRPPTLAEIENRYMAHILASVNGNKRQAAAILGVSRRTLYRRLAEAHGDAGEP